LRLAITKEMKITAISVLSLALVYVAASSAAENEYPRAYLSEGQVWIQRSGSEPAFQATHDCPNKYSPAVSLDRHQIAYGVTCVGKDHLLSAMSLVVLDASGKELSRFTPLSMTRLGDSCRQADHIEWIDGAHIAMVCEYNPSLEDYLVVNAHTGRVETEYAGLWFTRSPDHKTVAYGGFIVHFAPPIAQNYCLLFNEKTIYTQPCSNQVGSDENGIFRNIHTFAYPLVWSPDSRNIAFVEEISDWKFDPAPNERDTGKSINQRYYLVIASSDHAARGYRLSKPSQSSSLAWRSNSQIVLDGGLYDLEKDAPHSIP